MRLEHNRLVVSRRNLLTLLEKLDGHPPDSACEIKCPAIYGDFSIHAEEDDVHYNHISRGGVAPGVMHPDTEAALKGSNG